MLEILLVIYLCKQISNILRNKGRSPGWYQALLVALWIFGEVAGGITAMLLLDDGTGFNAIAYLGALSGAAVGAGVAFYLARQAAPTASMAPHGFPVVTQSPGHTGEL